MNWNILEKYSETLQLSEVVMVTRLGNDDRYETLKVGDEKIFGILLMAVL